MRMRLNRLSPVVLLPILISLAACHPQSVQAPASSLTVSSVAGAPQGCANDNFSASLQLPRTDSPPPRRDKSEPLEFAQVHTVNRPLQEVAVWTQRDGWSVLALQIESANARSIAVRLRDVKWPASTQAWLCSADGKTHQGPFNDAPDGELWTPIVPGSQARLEVWVPTASKGQFTALLADVYAGYR